MMPLSAMKVVVDPNVEETTTETITYPGHPIMQWLARWIQMDPDVHLRVTRLKADRYVTQFGDLLLMTPRMHQVIRNHLDTMT